MGQSDPRSQHQAKLTSFIIEFKLVQVPLSRAERSTFESHPVFALNCFAIQSAVSGRNL
jgi:hypothetical protein